MKQHLDRTRAEAADELHGAHATSVNGYEAIHLRIFAMADPLSDGIMGQFRSRSH